MKQKTETAQRGCRGGVFFSVLLLVVLYAFAIATLQSIVPRLTPTDESVISNPWWLLMTLIGMVFGALVCVLLKMADIARRRGQPGDLHQVRMGLIGGLSISITIFGGAVATLVEAHQYAQHLVRYGMDLKLADSRYWMSISILLGMVMGYIYALIVAPDE